MADRVRTALEAFADAADGEVRTVSVPTHDDAVRVNDALTLVELAATLDGGAVPGHRSVTPELRASLEEFVTGGPEVPPMISDLLALGAALLDGEGDAYGRAWRARERIVADLSAAFEGVDLLATPTCVSPPPAFDAVTTLADVYDTLRNTCPANLSGHPAVSLPCGTVEGGPVGLQLLAPRGADGFLLDAAATAEDV